MSTKKKNRGKQPIRLCVCCGKEAPKSDMLRIVVNSEGKAEEDESIDETGKKKGRGAYICRSFKCVDKAYGDGIIGEAARDESYESITKYVLQFIAIAMKAGKLASGEFSGEESIKDGQAKLIIIAENASDNTKEKFANKCKYYKVPYIYFSDKETLGRILGKNERSVVSVKDNEFGTKVLNIFGGNE